MFFINPQFKEALSLQQGHKLKEPSTSEANLTGKQEALIRIGREMPSILDGRQKRRKG